MVKCAGYKNLISRLASYMEQMHGAEIHSLFSTIDTDENGKLSKEEWLAAGLPEDIFSE